MNKNRLVLVLVVTIIFIFGFVIKSKHKQNTRTCEEKPLVIYSVENIGLDDECFENIPTNKLISIICQRDPLDASVDRLQFNSEKNDAANILFSLPRLPDGVVKELSLAVVRESEDIVWRDYAIQFLGLALEKRQTNKSFISHEDELLIKNVLNKALEMKEGTLAGTALFALYRANPVDAEIIENALIIVNDSTYSDSSFNAAFLLLEEVSYHNLKQLASEIKEDKTRTVFQRKIAQAVLDRKRKID